MVCRSLFIGSIFLLVFQGCYSLKGISIAPEIQTFYVEQFQNGVVNAPPDISQRFSDELKNRIIRNSRLDYNEELPDIEFTGIVSSFNVQAVAPERRSGQDGGPEFGSSLNRLNISVQVEYINNQDEEENWTKSFSFFEDFDNTEVLSDVQEDLIANIFDQLTQQIFNESFTNW